MGYTTLFPSPHETVRLTRPPVTLSPFDGGEGRGEGFIHFCDGQLSQMIGVMAAPEDHPVICEFFELFKTPWEFYRSDGDYEVVLDTLGDATESQAQLVIRYGSNEQRADSADRIVMRSRMSSATLSWNNRSIPIYGGCLTFDTSQASRLIECRSGQPATSSYQSHQTTVIRFGFDLFAEVRFLLRSGQPAMHAAIPALDLHIALLRDCILQHGLGLVEILPVPAGHRFMVCLTHDVDHPSLRLHRFDRTVVGFLGRAILGSILKVCRGRMPVRHLWQNWSAAISLPFIYAGWADDLWDTFEQYLELEAGLGSTYFVIPHRADPGQMRDGQVAPKARATAYGAVDIAPQLARLNIAGCEIGLHGIDAWLDADRGAKEKSEICAAVARYDMGVRMHWLYADERTPEVLDEAGFEYDSSFGYNDTVGFRAGTTQVFQPIGARHLLELPLHLMDTALFYPAHLNLDPVEARGRVQELIDAVDQFGGVLSINWHDRSLVPERLWGEFYVQMLDKLKSRSAWFSTAHQAITWFRQRRTVSLDAVQWNGDTVELTLSVECQAGIPGLVARIHKPRPSTGGAERVYETDANFVDLPFTGDLRTTVNLSDRTIHA